MIRVHLVAAGVGLLLAGTTFGSEPPVQKPVPAPMPPGGASEARQASDDSNGRDWQRSMNERFLEEDPKIGALIPDVSAYDAEGNKVRLREILAGQHAVLVFGCLT